MPSRVESINTFNLRLLKALLNFKINRNPDIELSSEQKRNLCKSYNSDEGILDIQCDYLLKIWSKEKEISHSISLNTLDQLCSILKPKYNWYIFISDVFKFRPDGIPDNKPYTHLNTHQKHLVNTAIESIFNKYKSFEEFESDVINRLEITYIKQKTEINHSEELNESLFDEDNKIQLSGTWFAVWQTTEFGKQKLTIEALKVEHSGKIVTIENLHRNEENREGAYMWKADCKLHENHYIMGEFLATEINVTAKGVLFGYLNINGKFFEGKWVGCTMDSPEYTTGFIVVAKERKFAEKRIREIITLDYEKVHAHCIPDTEEN